MEQTWWFLRRTKTLAVGPDGSKQHTRFLQEASISQASEVRVARVLGCLADSIQWTQLMRAMVVVASHVMRASGDASSNLLKSGGNSGSSSSGQGCTAS